MDHLVASVLSTIHCSFNGKNEKSFFVQLTKLIKKIGIITIFMGLFIATGLYILLTKTRLGVGIRAGQNDRQMISALGVDICQQLSLIT